MTTSRSKIWVGLASCGVAAGARKVYERFSNEIQARGLDADLGITGCVGACYKEPLIEVLTSKHGRVTYGPVTEECVARIVEEHLIRGELIKEWVVRAERYSGSEDRYFAKQERIVLRHCGQIDPESIDDYIAHNGYEALREVLSGWSPEQVIEEVERSGLRGRGGAGFPTGRKWRLTREVPGEEKYLICNGDEGDPGAFMDRSLLESDPHAVLEGMAIAAYAIGAHKGYIYVRAEYPLAVKRLRSALGQAQSRGFLGESILGSGFDFTIELFEGAGAFVCGEETALIFSIEGQRGMPRLRPPYPAVQGLWGRPTNINNVETYANIPWIIRNGAEAYLRFGTEHSKGTKTFALAGKVVRGGLIEVPMGITLREVIFDIGGGIKDGKRFKAVQIGGPSGGCLPEELLDLPVDYESITQTGAIMGSGGMVVMDESTCMVDVARFFLGFTQDESCGKCTFCRLGTRRMLEILSRITQGQGREGDLELLEELAQGVKAASLCGLGQTAPNPVLTTLRYFRDEYEAHLGGRCPALSCRRLIRYEIDPDKCTGCMACLKLCPVDAISGARKEPHRIEEARCTKCGSCYEKCPFEAITLATG